MEGFRDTSLLVHFATQKVFSSTWHNYTVVSRIISMHIYTSVKIIKNEVGCRDDTVPKTVETRRHCEED